MLVLAMLVLAQTCTCMYARMCVCARACMRARMRTCMRVCMRGRTAQDIYVQMLVLETYMCRCNNNKTYMCRCSCLYATCMSACTYVCAGQTRHRHKTTEPQQPQTSLRVSGLGIRVSGFGFRVVRVGLRAEATKGGNKRNPQEPQMGPPPFGPQHFNNNKGIPASLTS